MEYYEANPLPLVCKVCEASGNVDCGECEHALERFYLSRRDELILQRKAAERGIERFQRRIVEINKELEKLSNE